MGNWYQPNTFPICVDVIWSHDATNLTTTEWQNKPATDDMTRKTNSYIKQYNVKAIRIKSYLYDAQDWRCRSKLNHHTDIWHTLHKTNITVHIHVLEPGFQVSHWITVILLSLSFSMSKLMPESFLKTIHAVKGSTALLLFNAFCLSECTQQILNICVFASQGEVAYFHVRWYHVACPLSVHVSSISLPSLPLLHSVN